MKALILHGSPRKGSNTLILTNAFIKGVEEADVEVELIDINKLNVEGCRECLKCEKSFGCAIKDDMEMVYKKVMDSDIILLSSPIFFAGFPSKFKAVIDRFQMFYSRKYSLDYIEKKKRYGYLIFTAGNKNEKMPACMELTADFFFRSFDCKFIKSMYALSVDKVPISERQDLINEIYKEGLNIKNTIEG